MLAKISTPIMALCGVASLLLAAGTPYPKSRVPFVVRGDVDTLLLLLPDEYDPADPRITVWLDAAAEEGLHMEPISDTQFMSLRPDALQYAGVIMPDQAHMTASDALVTSLQNYVFEGGNVMLVYDAGALTPAGFYPIPKSRFSALVGVDYALYDELRDRTIGLGYVEGLQSRMLALRIPPGKSMPPDVTSQHSPLQFLLPTPSNPSGLTKLPTAGRKPVKGGIHAPLQRVAGPPVPHGHRVPEPFPADPLQQISGYIYGALYYPSFVTQGAYAGDVLLASADFGLVAGVNQFGSGRALFVNTPLGYLKEYGTDGLLLHGFLHYFAVDLLRLPYLAAVPRGTAGLVVNVHVDNGAAIDAFAPLDKMNVWDEGLFSIHFTAGPDTITLGDGLGMNLPVNSVAQHWVLYLSAKGHAIGSHGGWIHDYFGLHVDETNMAAFLPYISMNINAIEGVIRQPVIEYSAPLGNNPIWSTIWLEQNGFAGYYFAGNNGAAPTRSYRQGQLLTGQIWSFPVTSFGSVATFEELAVHHIPATDVTEWLTNLVDFAVQHRTARLFYFHPPGGLLYPDSLRAFLRQPDRYGDRKFNWYTMTGLAQFLSQREHTSWRVSLLSSGDLLFEARHPTDLAGQTWVLSKSAYKKVSVGQDPADRGSKQSLQVTDDKDADEWLVTVRGGRTAVQFTVTPQ